MKKIIKTFVLPLLLSTLFGFIIARAVYKIYKDDLDIRLSSSKVYLLKNGEYSSYEEMRLDNNYKNYIYYKDNNKYKSIIGITNEEDNIDKIKKSYNIPIEVEEYYISNGLIDNKQKEFDLKLKKTNSEKEIKELINNILEIYKKSDSISLFLSK